MTLICIAGKNSIAVDALKAVVAECPNNQVVVLPNATDTGANSWQPSLIAAARSMSIPVVQKEDLYDEEELVLFSLEYDRILSPTKFISNQLYNIHFSLLPAYKGMYTSAWPILNGESYSGVTLHLIDAGIDTGDIVAQTEIPIGIDDTARDLYLKYMEYGIRLFLAHYPRILCRDFRPVPQGSVGASYYSVRSIDYGNIQVDFRKTAFEVHNQVRAFCFPEYQLPEVGGYLISGSRMMRNRSLERPGCLVDEADDSLTFATIDYDVCLLKANRSQS